MIAEDFTVFWVESLVLLGSVSFPCRGPGVLALDAVNAQMGADGLAFGAPAAQPCCGLHYVGSGDSNMGLQHVEGCIIVVFLPRLHFFKI